MELHLHHCGLFINDKNSFSENTGPKLLQMQLDFMFAATKPNDKKAILRNLHVIPLSIIQWLRFREEEMQRRR